MNRVDRHLEYLRTRLKQPCNLTMLDYLASFPERRVKRFTISPFQTQEMVTAFRTSRRMHNAAGWREQPWRKRVRTVSGLIGQAIRRRERKMEFMVFIGQNRSHRQYVELTSGGRVAPWFECCPALSEFYRCFGYVTERKPLGDDGFRPWNLVMPLGAHGSFGRPMMPPPPSRLRPHPVIFVARSGDCAFVSQGRFRWYGWRRGNVKEIADSFPEFLLDYVRYRSKGDALPFDCPGRGRRRADYEIEVGLSHIDAAVADRRA